MNFMTQMYDQNRAPFSQPVSFHLKPDHFNETPEPYRRRSHTATAFTGLGEDGGSGSHHSGSHHHLRPVSMHGNNNIQLNDLSKANSTSISRLSHHSVANISRRGSTHGNKHGEVNHDEALVHLLLPEGETQDPSIGGKASEYLTPRCEESLSSDHDCSLEGCQRIIINVSGLRFETQLRTLERLPNTLLGNPDKRRRFWDETRQELFFDRHRPTFQAVLYYYQSGGRLKRPLEVPMDIFLNELHFYELGGSAIDSFKENEGYIVEKPNPMGPKNDILHKIWTTVEFPESSLLAKVFAVLSVSFILVSVVTFCVETLPEMKGMDCKNVSFVDAKGENVTMSVPDFTSPLFLTETCCIAWFVLELALRFISSPSKVSITTDKDSPSRTPC